MEALDKHLTLSSLCKTAGRWGMYVSFEYQLHVESHYEVGFEELQKAMPYFDPQEHGQIFADGEGYFLFDSAEEMEQAYDQTVGDEGPTPTNPYAGPVKVYALTCYPDGRFGNENT